MKQPEKSTVVVVKRPGESRPPTEQAVATDKSIEVPAKSSDPIFDLTPIDMATIGTLVLAVVTVVALLMGRRDRKLANEALKVSRAAFKIQIRPAMVEVPVTADPESFKFTGSKVPTHLDSGVVLVREDPELLRFAIPFRNAGNGLATIKTAWVEIPGSKDAFPSESFTSANVPKGENTRALFEFRKGQRGFDEVGGLMRDGQGFIVSLLYGDIDGGQMAKTTFFVVPHADDDDLGGSLIWEVSLIDMGTPGKDVAIPEGAKRRFY